MLPHEPNRGSSVFELSPLMTQRTPADLRSFNVHMHLEVAAADFESVLKTENRGKRRAETRRELARLQAAAGRTLVPPRRKLTFASVETGSNVGR
jgi:hypothetical protein